MATVLATNVKTYLVQLHRTRRFQGLRQRRCSWESGTGNVPDATTGRSWEGPRSSEGLLSTPTRDGTGRSCESTSTPQQLRPLKYLTARRHPVETSLRRPGLANRAPLTLEGKQDGKLVDEKFSHPPKAVMIGGQWHPALLGLTVRSPPKRPSRSKGQQLARTHGQVSPSSRGLEQDGKLSGAKKVPSTSAGVNVT